VFHASGRPTVQWSPTWALSVPFPTPWGRNVSRLDREGTHGLGGRVGNPARSSVSTRRDTSRSTRRPYRHHFLLAAWPARRRVGDRAGGVGSVPRGRSSPYPDPADAPAGVRAAPPEALLARAREGGGQLRVIVSLRARSVTLERSARASRACSRTSARGGARTAPSPARAYEASPCSRPSRSWP
jgi:hypothetical protein